MCLVKNCRRIESIEGFCKVHYRRYILFGDPGIGVNEVPEYQIYYTMRNRCYSSKSKQFECYGGRGIKVCDRWMECFDNFYIDMGSRPSMQHSLDRIDVNGDYKKSNCRWVTSDIQAKNRRKKVFVT